MGHFGGLQVIAAAVLHADDLDLRLRVLHPLPQTVAAVDAGAAGLVGRHDGDAAFIVDQLGEPVGGQRGGGKKDQHRVEEVSALMSVATYQARQQGRDRVVLG